MHSTRKLAVLMSILAALAFAPWVQAQNTSGCPERFFFSASNMGMTPPTAGLPVYGLGSESGPAGPPLGWYLSPTNVVISGSQISFDTDIHVPIHLVYNIWPYSRSIGVLAPGDYTVTVRSNMVSNQAIACPELIVPLRVEGTAVSFVPVPGPTGWMAALLGLLLTGMAGLALQRRQAQSSHRT